MIVIAVRIYIYSIVAAAALASCVLSRCHLRVSYPDSRTFSNDIRRSVMHHAQQLVAIAFSTSRQARKQLSNTVSPSAFTLNRTRGTSEGAKEQASKHGTTLAMRGRQVSNHAQIEAHAHMTLDKHTHAHTHLITPEPSLAQRHQPRCSTVACLCLPPSGRRGPIRAPRIHRHVLLTDVTT